MIMITQGEIFDGRCNNTLVYVVGPLMSGIFAYYADIIPQ